MSRTSGATSLYRSMKPPTADERQGASPPAVSIATVRTAMGTSGIDVRTDVQAYRGTLSSARCGPSQPGRDADVAAHHQRAGLPQLSSAQADPLSSGRLSSTRRAAPLWVGA